MFLIMNLIYSFRITIFCLWGFLSPFMNFLHVWQYSLPATLFCGGIIILKWLAMVLWTIMLLFEKNLKDGLIKFFWLLTVHYPLKFSKCVCLKQLLLSCSYRLAVNTIVFAGSGSFLRFSSERFWPGCWFLELVNNQVGTKWLRIHCTDR